MISLPDIVRRSPRWLQGLLGLSVTAALVGPYIDARTDARRIRTDAATVETAQTLYVPALWTTRLFFLGYDQTAADAMWLRAIDYFAQHFTGDRRYPFLVNFVDQIIALDPRFRRVYHWAGASVLYGQTFTNNNIRLSNRFYEAALANFPDDSEAALRLGLNYYVEMRADDPAERRKFQEQGAQYLEMAANMPGAPPNLKNLAASVYTRLGESELAVQSLLQMLETTEDPDQQAAIRDRIRKLRGSAEADEFAAQVEAFEARRKAHFEYLSPGLYLLIDGHADPVDRRRERSWRELIPDVTVGESAPAAEDK